MLGGLSMTPEILSGAVAVILSLAFSYIPKLNSKFAELEPEVKRLIMLALLVITAAASYGLACWGVLESLTGLPMECGQAGLFELLRVLVVAIVTNQSVYSLSPQTPSVRAAKAARG
jgi:hypothetical protein